MMGQLPIERVTPDPIFSKTGVDYAGPVYIKQGYTRKPVVLKAYICVFVSLSVKAVHLELVSDLTSESFIACLRRFISRRRQANSNLEPIMVPTSWEPNVSFRNYLNSFRKHHDTSNF